MALSKAAKKAKNAYLKEWKKRNPEKVKKHFHDYWERKAQREIEQRVHELKKEGYSYREIADETGINHMKVARIIKGE